MVRFSRFLITVQLATSDNSTIYGFVIPTKSSYYIVYPTF